MSATIIPNAGHITEFATDPTTKEWYNGTCGETALAVALACTQENQVAVTDMLRIVRDMKARGLIPRSSNGAATLTELAQEAAAQGAQIAEQHNYTDDGFSGVNWQTILQREAGVRPIVLQLANGQALADYVNGVHDERGLHYHYVCIVGVESDKYYYVADGDSPNVGKDFEHYSISVLQAARPCAMLVLAMKTARAGGSPVPQSNGWQDDGSVITAPNGIKIEQGFAEYLRRHPDFVAFAGNPAEQPMGVDPVGGDPAHGPGAEAVFTFAGLAWIPKEGVVRPLWVGAMLVAVRQQLTQAQQAATGAQAQVTQLQQAATSAQAEIAQLQQAATGAQTQVAQLQQQVVALTAERDALKQQLPNPLKS